MIRVILPFGTLEVWFIKEYRSVSIAERGRLHMNDVERGLIMVQGRGRRCKTNAVPLNPTPSREAKRAKNCWETKNKTTTPACVQAKSFAAFYRSLLLGGKKKKRVRKSTLITPQQRFRIRMLAPTLTSYYIKHTAQAGTRHSKFSTTRMDKANEARCTNDLDTSPIKRCKVVNLLLIG